MILVETPLSQITRQRAALEHLLHKEDDLCAAARIEGMLEVLDWLEHGGETPVERA